MTRIKTFGYRRGCDFCSQIIEKETRSVQHGSWTYHLICFNKFMNNKLQESLIEIKKIETLLKLLKPYKKEMICECLEVNKVESKCQ